MNRQVRAVTLERELSKIGLPCGNTNTKVSTRKRRGHPLRELQCHRPLAKAVSAFDPTQAPHAQGGYGGGLENDTGRRFPSTHLGIARFLRRGKDRADRRSKTAGRRF